MLGSATAAYRQRQGSPSRALYWHVEVWFLIQCCLSSARDGAYILKRILGLRLYYPCHMLWRFPWSFFYWCLLLHRRYIGREVQNAFTELETNLRKSVLNISATVVRPELNKNPALIWDPVVLLPARLDLQSHLKLLYKNVISLNCVMTLADDIFNAFEACLNVLWSWFILGKATHHVTSPLPR